MNSAMRSKAFSVKSRAFIFYAGRFVDSGETSEFCLLYLYTRYRRALFGLEAERAKVSFI